MISKILKDFIEVWKAYEGSELSTENAVKRINSGDCGLTAIAAHHVLLHKFNVKTDIIINRNHCWLSIDGTDYDTSMPNGYASSANEVWSKGCLEDTFELSFKAACDEWMPCDTYGGYLVKAFVERYGLTLPSELQHCIDKADEYEGAQGMPAILAKYEAARKIPCEVQ